MVLMGPIDLYIHVDSYPTIQMLQQKLRLNKPGNIFPIFFNFGEPVRIVASVSYWFIVHRRGAWCSLLLLSSASRFRDAFLHMLVVRSGYLGYCGFSISSKQSRYSRLTSNINKAFSSSELPLTGYFIFLRSVNGKL